MVRVAPIRRGGRPRHDRLRVVEQYALALNLAGSVGDEQEGTDVGPQVWSWADIEARAKSRVYEHACHCWFVSDERHLAGRRLNCLDQFDVADREIRGV